MKRLASVILPVLLLLGASPLPAQAATVTLVGAGDIADCSNGPVATANIVKGIAGTVFTTGDNAYGDGSTSNFNNCYDPTWGQFKSRTKPSPGNHDYHTSGGAGYFAYFGVNPYYAYDLGDWRIYSLNAEIGLSAEVTWLKNDLAAHPTDCVAAYWHEPLFSSGKHGNDTGVKPFWDALYAAGADLILNGHDHDYERFAPQDPSGKADSQFGIRELVIGTGGAGVRAFVTTRPNSEKRIDTTLGVLELTLTATGYSGQFHATSGSAIQDTFSGNCHGAPSGGGSGGGGGSTTLTLSATVSNGDVNLSWNAVTGATQYRVRRAVGSGSFTTLRKQTGTTYTDTTVQSGTTYRYRVIAVTSSSKVKSNIVTIKP